LISAENPSDVGVEPIESVQARYNEMMKHGDTMRTNRQTMLEALSESPDLNMREFAESFNEMSPLEKAYGKLFGKLAQSNIVVTRVEGKYNEDNSPMYTERKASMVEKNENIENAFSWFNTEFANLREPITSEQEKATFLIVTLGHIHGVSTPQNYRTIRRMFNILNS
jgi:hypothetical protein